MLSLELSEMYGTERVVPVVIFLREARNLPESLQQATAQELECWADNILDAKTLDEVFVCH